MQSQHVADDAVQLLQHVADDAVQLLQHVARGERQALADLYARYQRQIFAYLLQLTPDRGLAEEILQDTFVAVWKNAHTFEQRATVQTWLLGIARRQAHNTLRQHTVLFALEEELETLPANEPKPEDALLASTHRDILIAAFQRLATPHREVLILTFIEELPQQEIAQLLHIPLGTVKSRLSNARRQLRSHLADIHAEEESQL